MATTMISEGRRKLTRRPVHIDLNVDPVIYEKARQIVISRGDNMSNDYRCYLRSLVGEYEVKKHRQTVSELLDNDNFAVVKVSGNSPKPEPEECVKLQDEIRQSS